MISASEQPVLAPVWRAGEAWTVRYRFSVPSLVKAKDPPPAFEEREYVFTVDERTDHVVRITAQHEANIWRYTFAPHGRLMSVRDPWGEEPFDSGDDRPLVPLGYQVGLTRAWPRFPVEEDVGFEHSGLRQRSREVGSDLEVTIVREGRVAGADGVRTAKQRWQRGRPWWSTLEIDVDGHLQVEAEVIAWPQSTP